MRALDISRSKLRAKLLVYFFTNPETRIHLRDLAVRLNEDPGNLSRELKRLSGDGFFRVEEIGRQKFFSLNKEYGLYEEFKGVVLKTIGLPEQLKKIFESEPDVSFAFIYGSFASASASMDSDVDLMLLVQDPECDVAGLQNKIAALEHTLNREINWNYYPIEEWAEKARRRESFVENVLSSPMIILKGNERELRRLNKKQPA